MNVMWSAETVVDLVVGVSQRSDLCLSRVLYPCYDWIRYVSLQGTLVMDYILQLLQQRERIEK
jgi:hypothetical protein